MKILYELITQQDSFINGGSLYAKKILTELEKKEDAELFYVYDSRRPIPNELKKIITINKEKTYDLKEYSIAKVCETCAIEKVVINISQRFEHVSFENVKVPIITVCHDIGDVVMEGAEIYERKIINDFLKINAPNKKKKNLLKCLAKAFLQKQRIGALKRKTKNESKNEIILSRYYNFSRLIKQKNVYIVTVSQYSKSAIEYYFNDIANEINVFLPPIKNYEIQDSIYNKEVENLLNSKQEYFLLVSCDRYNKNAGLFYQVFDKFNKQFNNRFKAVMIGGLDANVGENIISIHSVESSDLENLYKNAVAFVYPTINEGFGSPPVEAMKYGTPVVASYCTAIPEILEDAPLYFNACYPDDLYGKLIKLVEQREAYVVKSSNAFMRIEQKQAADLNKYIDFILKR